MLGRVHCGAGSVYKDFYIMPTRACYYNYTVQTGNHFHLQDLFLIPYVSPRMFEI